MTLHDSTLFLYDSPILSNSDLVLSWTPFNTPFVLLDIILTQLPPFVKHRMDMLFPTPFLIRTVHPILHLYLSHHYPHLHFRIGPVPLDFVP